MSFPIITKTIQQEYERRYAAAPSGMPQICGCHGRACRQLDNTEGANLRINRNQDPELYELLAKADNKSAVIRELLNHALPKK